MKIYIGYVGYCHVIGLSQPYHQTVLETAGDWNVNMAPPIYNLIPSRYMKPKKNKIFKVIFLKVWIVK